MSEAYEGEEQQPEAVTSIVELLPGANEFFQAFWELSSERQVSLGVVGPIPARALDYFAQRLSDGDQDLFRTCIRAMDEVLLKHINEQIQRRPE